jgi:hypothetical protein
MEIERNILRIYRNLFIERLSCDNCYDHTDHFIKMQGCDTEKVCIKAECRVCITKTTRNILIKEWNKLIPVQKEQLNLFKENQLKK